MESFSPWCIAAITVSYLSLTEGAAILHDSIHLLLILCQAAKCQAEAAK